MEAVAVPAASEEISLGELIKLCALDSELFGKVFFPRAFRQESPTFARAMWEVLENPGKRLVSMMCFRGSSKTTRLRTFAAKRLSYGISRTILIIGEAEKDAIRSVGWIRRQVERNAYWCQTFGLRPGSKWEETQIEIVNENFDIDGGSRDYGKDGKPLKPPMTIWILAAGMTGSLRGINFDDYRPDLIIVDDPQSDESAATDTQRKKTIDLLLGAVKNSLAPATDEPNAKLVMALTPINKEDVAHFAMKDEEFHNVVFPCWTQETMNRPVEQQESSWPSRFPSEELRTEKRLATQRGKLYVFTREKECRVSSEQTAKLRMTWLNVREPGIRVPRGCYSVMAIDPVPPPSATQIAKGLADKDYEAHYVWSRWNGDYHLADYDKSKGHEPSWTIATAFRLYMLWRPTYVVVEAIAYQRVLEWLLKEEMARRGVYFTVIPYVDRRSKYNRIVSTIGDLASNGKLWVGADHTEFVSQYESYPDVEFDDDLDASAIALSYMSNPFLEAEEGGSVLELDNSHVEEFPWKRAAP